MPWAAKLLKKPTASDWFRDFSGWPSLWVGAVRHGFLGGQISDVAGRRKRGPDPTVLA